MMEMATFYPLISVILSIQPDRPQLFRYEALTLNCAVPEHFSSWTVKRNTSNGPLKTCGLDWGRANGTSCLVSSVYTSDTGVYWCESERGEKSNVLDITVTADGVILEIPALPVTDGDTVTLRCSQKDRYAASSVSNFSATFFKDDVFIGTQPKGKLILPSVSESDEGFYKCLHPSGVESPLSRLTVEGSVGSTGRTTTNDAVILSIQPNRPQLFRYEALTLNCAVSEHFSSWTVKRNTSNEPLKTCELDWGRANGSSCFVSSVYTSDTGVYWCESERGEKSNVLDITVTADGVILEIPALPVVEGDTVTLRCSQKDRYAASSVSNFSATFFKDNVFIGTQPKGKLILPSVSESDEGFYKCLHPSGVESPLSRLTVEGSVGSKGRTTTNDASDHKMPTSSTPTPSLFKIMCYFLLLILYTLIIILCIYGYLRWSRARREAKERDGEYFIPVWQARG